MWVLHGLDSTICGVHGQDSREYISWFCMDRLACREYICRVRSGQNSREYICRVRHGQDSRLYSTVCVFGIDRNADTLSHHADRADKQADGKECEKDRQETMFEVSREEEGNRNA
jgi:hypothetical protein